jgi:hypothetical protein
VDSVLNSKGGQEVAFCFKKRRNLSVAAQSIQKKFRIMPPVSRFASYHEEVNYQEKGECREGCLKVALEQFPCTETYEEEYENEEQDNRQFIIYGANCFFH